MRWLGIGLALAGVVVALIAAFGFPDIKVPFLIGGILFAAIGMIVFMNGYRHQP